MEIIRIPQEITIRGKTRVYQPVADVVAEFITERLHSRDWAQYVEGSCLDIDAVMRLANRHVDAALKAEAKVIYAAFETEIVCAFAATTRSHPREMIDLSRVVYAGERLGGDLAVRKLKPGGHRHLVFQRDGATLLLGNWPHFRRHLFSM